MNIFRLLGDLYWKFDFWLSDELQPAKEELKVIVRVRKIRPYTKSELDEAIEDWREDEHTDITYSHLLHNIHNDD